MNLLEKREELKRNKNATVTENVEFTTVVEDLFYLYEKELSGEVNKLEYHAFGDYEGGFN